MKKQFIAAVLVAVVPVAATAADLTRADRAPMYTKAPAPAAVLNWSGCYLGGHVGGAWSNDSYTHDNGAGLVEPFTFNPTSFMGGGQLGCQIQVTGLVLGVEGTLSALDLNQTDLSLLSPGRQRSFRLDEMATATGRLGYAFDRWMIYAKGGWADARIDTFAMNPATGVFVDINNWESGWTVGGGIEWMPWPSIVLGAEFDYYSFTFDRTGIASDLTTSRFFNTQANVYAGLFRLSYLLNWSGPVMARY
jgi:outer membrane immunogenic protein